MLGWQGAFTFSSHAASKQLSRKYQVLPDIEWQQLADSSLFL